MLDLYEGEFVDVVSEKKTIDPNYVEVVNLFNGSCVYKVPKYQRGYAWESSEVEEFCNDLFDCLSAYDDEVSLEHFFGGVVCIEEKPENNKQTYKCFSIVDGQQRISTFLLFISKVRNILEGIRRDIDEKYQKAVGNLIETFEKNYLYYIESRNLEELKYKKLEMSIKDADFYDSVVYSNETIKPVTDSHKRILSAASLINDMISARIKGLSFVDAVKVFENINALLSTKCHILKITTNKTDDAYRLFQVLNDRGRALSACDLLRASSLSRYEDSQNTVLQDQAADIWDEITEDRERDVEKYLSYYYVSKTGSKLKKLDLYSKFNKKFFENSDPDEVFKRLVNISDELKLIKLLENGDWPYEVPTLNSWHQQRLKFLVVRLKHSECIPLLLSATNLTESKFSELVVCLEKFFFRFKTVLKKRFDPVVKIYLEEIEKINKNPGTYAIQSIQSKLRKVIEERTSDSEFTQSLLALEFLEKESKDSISGNRVIKYLLLQMEENHAWLSSDNNSLNNRKKSLDKSIAYDFPSVSIEHIYPKKSKSKDNELEAVKNTIANLTLLDRDINSNLGDKSYDDKKEHYKASKFKLNNSIALNDKWCINCYENRKKEMIKSIPEIFRI